MLARGVTGSVRMLVGRAACVLALARRPAGAWCTCPISGLSCAASRARRLSPADPGRPAPARLCRVCVFGCREGGINEGAPGVPAGNREATAWRSCCLLCSCLLCSLRGPPAPPHFCLASPHRSGQVSSCSATVTRPATDRRCAAWMVRRLPLPHSLTCAPWVCCDARGLTLTGPSSGFVKGLTRAWVCACVDEGEEIREKK